MFACPGLIFYTVCSVPWLNGNLALAEKCSGPLRFRLRQGLLYKEKEILGTRPWSLSLSAVNGGAGNLLFQDNDVKL